MDRDVSQDEHALAELEELGYLTRPVIQIDGVVVVGFDRKKLDALPPPKRYLESSANHRSILRFLSCPGRVNLRQRDLSLAERSRMPDLVPAKPATLAPVDLWATVERFLRLDVATGNASPKTLRDYAWAAKALASWYAEQGRSL